MKIRALLACISFCTLDLKPSLIGFGTLILKAPSPFGERSILRTALKSNPPHCGSSPMPLIWSFTSTANASLLLKCSGP